MALLTPMSMSQSTWLAVSYDYILPGKWTHLQSQMFRV